MECNKQTGVLATVKFPVQLRQGVVPVQWAVQRNQKWLIPKQYRGMCALLFRLVRI